MGATDLGLDLVASLKRAMEDQEFSREMRYYTGAIKIGVGSQETVGRFEDGKLTDVAVATVPDEECRIILRGTEDHWDKMLERYPVPFYQCLQTVNIKHGLGLSTTNETYAYLPALNRLVQFLREERTKGS